MGRPMHVTSHSVNAYPSFPSLCQPSQSFSAPQSRRSMSPVAAHWWVVVMHPPWSHPLFESHPNPLRIRLLLAACNISWILLGFPHHSSTVGFEAQWQRYPAQISHLIGSGRKRRKGRQPCLLLWGFDGLFLNFAFGVVREDFSLSVWYPGQSREFMPSVRDFFFFWRFGFTTFWLSMM